jgi:precorrin-2 dehydrogenase/sirohydrochlorin ferrochelatase
MDAFPAFYPLKDAKVVIAGDGEPAAARARLFAGSPAQVAMIEGEAALDPAAYLGARLVFIASFDDAFAAAASAAARGSGAPINVFDRPVLSDFHTPAVVDRGAVVAAVGTAGSAPVMAQLLRAELEMRIPESVGTIAALLGERRAALKSAFPDLVQRRAFVRAMLAELASGDEADAAARLDRHIAQGWASVGRVWLIAPPAADDLISLRAVRALNVADVISAPPRAASLAVAHGRRDAERLELDGATPARLADLASSGKMVAVVTDDGTLEPALHAAGVAVERLQSAPAAA